MALLRTKYSGELSVLLTWLVALLPWSVTYASIPLGQQSISVFWIRFLPLRFLYILDGEVPGEQPFLPVWSVPGFVETAGETTAAWLWLAGAVVFLVPLVLSIVYYLAEDRLEALAVDPVRLQGGLLLLVGGILAVPTYILWTDLPGTTVPVGSLFLVVFGLVLLGVEQVEPDDVGE
jgi:uncharacterized protein (TIGR04206 family)